MAVNPYASYLESRDPLEAMRATPVQLENLVQSLGPEKLELTPAPGKWSVRDILSHLADCELVFAFRMRQAVAADHPVVQPFDQDQWAATYGHYDARVALNVFSAIRQWNLEFLGGLAPADFERTLTHPERGEMTLRIVTETIAGHDLNHLRQVEAFLAYPR